MQTATQSPKPPLYKALPAKPIKSPSIHAVGERRSTPRRANTSKGIWTDQITGRFRKITVHQLAMTYWCYQAGHITLRQLRVTMAAHEMAERRRYTDPVNGPERPLYGLDEIKSLVGGRGSKTADAELSADVRTLARLGLATITDHAIGFAVSVDQLRLDGTDDLDGFWSMFNQLPHPRRSVPVPRRMLRALAAGFTKGMTAVVIATLIRSLFWHRSRGGEGAYRTDGRTKREWIAEVFSIAPRTVTDARSRLIELGWLIPQETPQYLLNRYGTHDAINTDWSPADSTPASSEALTAPLSFPTAPNKPATTQGDPDSSGGVNTTKPIQPAHRAPSAENEPPQHNGLGQTPHTGESASPNRDFSGRSASPDLNRSLPLTGNKNTRKPAPMRAGPTGASPSSAGGSRKKKIGGSGLKTSIRDIRAGDLEDMGRVLELYRQAVGLGMAKSGEGGRLDFVALAQRARSKGRKAGALFFWLLRENKTEFITLADEDEAGRRIKAHLYGSTNKRERWGGQTQQGRGSPPPEATEYTDDERFVLACIRVANQKRIADPFDIARMKGWSRDQWDQAHAAYQQKQLDQWKQAETPDESGGR
jgi:hypothetical protein